MLAVLWLSSLVALSTLDVVPSNASVPAPAPVESAVAKQPLHEIAHVRALTPFCAAFEKHFNGAARPIVNGDANVGYLGYTMGGIEPHFHSRGGETAIYDDRVHMMAYLATLQKAIPQAQDEINALRKSAKLASDPADAAATVALASDLQTALDKQKQIAIDSLGVVQALSEYTQSPSRLGFDDLGNGLGTAGQAVAALSRPDPMGFLGSIEDDGPRASTELQSGVPGGYDDYTVRTPSDRRDVRQYLHWQNQLDRIGDAESSAVGKAGAISDRCN